MKRETLQDLLGSGGHSTEYQHLHPNIQANLAEAESTLLELANRIGDNHISDLGISTAYDGVTDAFYAVLDRTGEKAQLLGYTPMMIRLGERRERFEVPSPFLITIQSSISARCAVVLVVFTDYNPINGYGDWNTAILDSAGFWSDSDEAEEFLKRVARALATKELVARESDPTKERGLRGGDTRPAF